MEEQYNEQAVPVDLHVCSFRHASRCQYSDNRQKDFDCTTSESLIDHETRTRIAMRRCQSKNHERESGRRHVLGISFSFIDKQVVNT
jgi:hypothetical protein